MFSANPLNCNPNIPLNRAAPNTSLIAITATSLPASYIEPLIISGKSTFHTNCTETGQSFFGNFLYNTDEDGFCSAIVEMPPAENGNASCDDPWGRLAVDGDGTLYQIHSTQGVFNMQTGDCVLGTRSDILFGNDLEISIGFFFGQSASSPILDIAFDLLDPNTAYITPVSVHPLNSECEVSYQATAKVKLSNDGQGTYEILAIYGEKPGADLIDCNSVVYFLNEPHFQNPTEVEIGLDGRLYVLSTNSSSENNWLLTYDTLQQAPEVEDFSLNDPGLFGPASLLVSKRNNSIYLVPMALEPDDPGDLLTRIANFNIDFVNQQITQLHFIEVQTPDPNRAFCDDVTNGCRDLDTVEMITSITENPANGTIYATGFTAPRLADDLSLSNVTPGVNRLHTTAFVAEILPDDSQVIAVPISDCSSADPLALPLSIVWGRPLPEVCKSPADIFRDCQINILDFSLIAEHWMTSSSIADIAPQAAPDNIVNELDLALLAQYWLLTETP